MPQLETDRLVLRLVQPDDVQEVCRYWAANGDRYMPPLPKRLEAPWFWSQRIAGNLEAARQDSAYRFYLFDRRGAIVGTLGLFSVERGPAQSAKLSYGIAKSAEGKGLMSEALARVVDFAFGRARLHQLWATSLEHNRRSRNVLERAGFVQHARLPASFFLDDRWHDELLYGLLERSHRRAAAYRLCSPASESEWNACRALRDAVPSAMTLRSAPDSGAEGSPEDQRVELLHYGKEVVATVCFRLAGDTAWIDDVGVVDSGERRKHAEALLGLTRAVVRNLGCVSVRCNAGPEAQSFYIDLGFQRVESDDSGATLEVRA